MFNNKLVFVIYKCFLHSGQRLHATQMHGQLCPKNGCQKVYQIYGLAWQKRGQAYPKTGKAYPKLGQDSQKYGQIHRKIEKVEANSGQATETHGQVAMPTQTLGTMALQI